MSKKYLILIKQGEWKMEGMLSALVLLCGLDYSGNHYTECVKKTGQCHASMTKSLPARKAGTPLNDDEKMVFYRCYSEGAVAEAKDLKRK